MTILYALVAGVLGAFCYRIGGLSKQDAAEKFPWFPQVLVKSWFRDANCTLLSLGYWLLFMPHVSWYWYVLACGATYGAMTTYWDNVPPQVGTDKFWMHGMGIGLATLFVAIPAGVWIGALIRLILMAIFMGVWCFIWADADIEEYGRGAIIGLTLPFLRGGN